MTAYSYIRLVVVNNYENSSYVGAATIRLLDSTGTNIATDPTQASASSQYDGGYSAANAVAGQPGEWVTNGSGGTIYWQYHLAVPLDAPVTFEYTARGSSTGNSPRTMQILASVDGTSFDTIGRIYDRKAQPDGSETRSFPIKTVGSVPNPPREVGICCNANAPNSGSNAFTAVKILLFSGGVNLATDPAKASATDTVGGRYPASNAIVGQSGWWSAFNTQGPQVWVYDLGPAPPVIDSFSMSARNDVDYTQTPTSFDLVTYDDTGYVAIIRHFDTTWTQGQTQTFSVAGTRCSVGVRCIPAAQGNPGAFSAANISLFSGGVNLATDPAKASATDTIGGRYPASQAVVGQGPFWAALSGQGPQTWFYDFGSTSPVIDTISITARNDVDYTQTPTSFDLITADGQGVVTVLRHFDTTWTQGQTQTFSVSGAVTPPSTAARSSVYVTAIT